MKVINRDNFWFLQNQDKAYNKEIKRITMYMQRDRINGFPIADHSPSFPFQALNFLFRKDYQEYYPTREGTDSQYEFASFCRSSFMHEKRKDLFKFAQKKLEGEIVIDLGCGSKSGNALKLSKLFGAGMYVGVDKNIEEGLAELIFPEIRDMNAIKIITDFFGFVNSLTDCSVNYIVNGIDRCVVRNKEDSEFLIEQINRTAKKEGILMGNNNFLVEKLIAKGWRNPFEEEDSKYSSWLKTDRKINWCNHEHPLLIVKS